MKTKKIITEFKENLLKWYSKKYCLEAVKQDPWALQYVKNQTEEMCLEALNQDIDIIEHVDVKKFPKVYEKYLFIVK